VRRTYCIEHTHRYTQWAPTYTHTQYRSPARPPARPAHTVSLTHTPSPTPTVSLTHTPTHTHSITHTHTHTQHRSHIQYHTQHRSHTASHTQYHTPTVSHAHTVSLSHTVSLTHTPVLICMASSLVGAIMRATGDRRLEYWFQFLSRKSSTGSPKARVLPGELEMVYYWLISLFRV
jgi:hypothetical protein